MVSLPSMDAKKRMKIADMCSFACGNAQFNIKLLAMVMPCKYRKSTINFYV